MNFVVPPQNANGPADPQNLAARGSEPLLLLPTPHILRNINHRLLPVPGALAAIPNCIHLSVATSLAMLAMQAAPNVEAVEFFLVGILPAKLDAIFAQLAAEPAGRNLDLAAAYASPMHLAYAIGKVVAQLDGDNLHPAYILNAGDTYDLEASNALPAQMAAVLTGNEAFTFAQARDARGFLSLGSFLTWVTPGRCLAADRDGVGAPTRDFLHAAVGFAQTAGKMSTAAVQYCPAVALRQWLLATQMNEPPLVLLAETDETSASRREQSARNRQA